jgi:hypothetical protein
VTWFPPPGVDDVRVRPLVVYARTRLCKDSYCLECSTRHCASTRRTHAHLRQHKEGCGDRSQPSFVLCPTHGYPAPTQCRQPNVYDAQRCGRALAGLLDLHHRAQATCADVHAARRAIDHQTAALDVDQKPAIGLAIRVADAVAILRGSPAHITARRHGFLPCSPERAVVRQKVTTAARERSASTESSGPVEALR